VIKTLGGKHFTQMLGAGSTGDIFSYPATPGISSYERRSSIKGRHFS
jgi:hypothetical protein